MRDAVLLDTSFLIRLLNEEYPLHPNAVGYYKYFLEREITMVCSTISIGEYCVVGGVEDLPLKNLQILPYNFDHACRAGTLAAIAFEARRAKAMEVKDRLIIPIDTKLFAQADITNHVTFFISADVESFKVYNAIQKTEKLCFRFLDLNVNFNSAFGLLDFPAE